MTVDSILEALQSLANPEKVVFKEKKWRIALDLCHDLLENNDGKAAQWIAKDALRELENEGVRCSDYPRALYR